MNDSMLARRRLRLSMLLVIEQLVGVSVDSPGDWETIPADLPNIKLRNDVERKASNARAMPTFTTTATLELIARVEGVDGDEAQDRIEDLGYRIEQAVLAAPGFIKWLQQVSGITSTTRVSAAGKRHVGELQMAIDCETFESFDPVLINPNDYPALQQLLINVDTINPFDPGAGISYADFSVDDDVGDGLVVTTGASGNYPNPPFPDAVKPAPRTSGPDGRNEGTLLLNLAS